MTDATETEAAAALPAPAAPSFVDAAGRSATVELDWPVEYDGKIYDRITVRRLTVGEVADFLAAFLDAPASKDRRHFPMFDCPPAVLDALDDDDGARVDEVATRFLPRRFRAVLESAPPPEAGVASPPA